MARTNTSRANTDTSSKDDVSRPSEEGAGEICPICKGAGFVHPALDSGKVDFSRVVPCRCSKGELRKKKTEYLEKYSNLGSLSQLTFDNTLLRFTRLPKPLLIIPRVGWHFQVPAALVKHIWLVLSPITVSA